MPRWERIVLALSLAAMGGWWVGKSAQDDRTGFIVVATTPAAAAVFIDGVKVGDSSPVMIERTPGRTLVSVTRDGYMRSDQDVDVSPGRSVPLDVKLAGSPDTGFELTSDPPGLRVWLDGEPMMSASDSPMLTDFRASAISPGHHVLIIRDERFLPWVQDIEVSPGNILKIRAVLIPRPRTAR